jgi:hypothetical protein
MAQGKQPSRSPKDLAAEVDALLKKLPYADPAAPDSGMQTGPGGAASVPLSASGNRRAAQLLSPAEQRQANLWVWARVGLAAVFAVALTQWPYARACGFGLFAYGTAVLVLQVAGGWCAIASWKRRLPWAHAFALIMVFWGITLAAEIVLPRVGYASEQATWWCVS